MQRDVRKAPGATPEKSASTLLPYGIGAYDTKKGEAKVLMTLRSGETTHPVSVARVCKASLSFGIFQKYVTA